MFYNTYCRKTGERTLSLSYFGTLPTGMLQDIMESLSNQMHISPEILNMSVVRFAQALTFTQLPKHHRKHLIPACEMFYMVVASIVVELSHVQKSG